jgi:hypothetical protein
VQYSGVVGKHFAKQWQNKTFWSFTLKGQDGFFNMGMKKPPAEGSSVEFEATLNNKGYNEVEAKSIKFRQDGEPSTASIRGSASSRGGSGGGGLSKDEYWQRKEDRDLVNDSLRELGASRNTAIALIDLMFKHEAIKLPAQAKREEFVWELLNRYTEKLMNKPKTEDKVPDSEGSAEAADTASPGPSANDDDNWN